MKIYAIDNNGIEKEYDVILTYYSKEYNKNYVVYTDNVYNEKEELKIYINKYNPENVEEVSTSITNNEEYNKIKTEINKILLTMKNENDKLNITEWFYKKYKLKFWIINLKTE